MLAETQNPSLNRGPKWSSQPHCHVTGTLPFVAYDLLKHGSQAKERQHALHHDVESTFWVLLYICLKRGYNVPKTLGGLYELLNSCDVAMVMHAKFVILGDHYQLWSDILGNFAGFQYYLLEFIKYYQCQ